MNNYNKKSSGNWKDGKSAGRGGNDSWQRNDDRGSRPSMHRAVCDQCHESCQVPFKPNGSKPVLCSDCFSKDGGGSSSSYNDKRGGRSNSYERPAYRSTPRAGSDDLAKQLKMLNRKVDQILEILSDLDEDEEGFDEELDEDLVEEKEKNNDDEKGLDF